MKSTTCALSQNFVSLLLTVFHGKFVLECVSLGIVALGRKSEHL
jgi:hypothetical protein